MFKIEYTKKSNMEQNVKLTTTSSNSTTTTTIPRVLKGFRDALPCAEIARERLIAKIKKTFSLYGYAPIDTPCLEYEEILLSKSGGETEKQIYAFTDNGGRRIALRFDLTVPFARFVAEHVHKEIELPFKRYHIGKVWRGEKSQAGRYREFYQCDIDEVGSTSASSDAEIINAIASALLAIGVDNFKVHISHRALLQDLTSKLGYKDKCTDILRILDKMPKIGKDAVHEQLLGLSVSEDDVNDFILFASFKQDASVLKDISNITSSFKKGINESAIQRLCDIYSLLNENIKSHIVLDFSITRGLDYYTGFVFETFITGSENTGSISSGGRYDDLTSHFTKEKISGVGGSIGLDRLLSIISASGQQNTGTADVYVVSKDGSVPDSKLIQGLRDNGIRTDVAFESVKNNKAYRYAELNLIPFILFVSEGGYYLKNIATREEEKVESQSDMIKKIKSQLANNEV